MTCRELWVLMNASHPSLSDTKFAYNALSEFMYKFISRTRSRYHQTPVKKSVFLDPSSTICPSDTHFPGGNRRRIDLKIE